MRRLVTTGVLMTALLPAGFALATTEPPDTTIPADTAADTTMAETTTAGTPASESATTVGDSAAAGGPATVYDDEGNPVAAITASDAETGWSDYPEDEAPESGREYVRMSVTVESLVTEGAFAVNVDNFVLQDNWGFITTAENIPTATQAETDEEITSEAELANGESVELTLTFEVTSGAGAQSVFYRPEDDRLVDVAEVA